jgi:hypothetical protein
MIIEGYKLEKSNTAIFLDIMKGLGGCSTKAPECSFAFLGLVSILARLSQ